jgi:P27 family predicted phage terminase small subunit
MGERGPKPRPDHLKAVAGVEDRYRNHDEPKPAAPAPGVDLTKPPTGLGAKAAAVWRKLAPDLVERKVLTAWDIEAFAAYCIVVSQFHEARKAVAKYGITDLGSQGQRIVSPYLRAQSLLLEAELKLAGRFGLTPGDRAGLVIPQAPGGQNGQPAPAGPERLLS